MKKCFIRILFSFVMLVAACFAYGVNVYAFSGAGKGTAQEPYLISNVQQLNEVRNGLSSSYKLVADIDLQNEEWVPIGTLSSSFKGTFDGGGYTISNLRITIATSDYVGFFGYVDDGNLKNLNILNVNISGNKSVGGLVGQMKKTTVDRCSITGNGTISGTNGVGGLIGCIFSLSGTTSNLTNSNVGVDIIGETNVGGLVGYTNANIKWCYATGNVSGVSSIGGLIGYGSSSDSNNISECYATGDVVGTSGSVGGLIGYISDSTGIYKKIVNCFALGNVSGSGNSGGFIGSNYLSSSSSSVSNCYSAGKVTSSGSSFSGFSTEKKITNCYYDSLASQVLPVSSTDYSKLTIGMVAQTTYKNWDFNNVWSIDEGSSYPYLKNLAKPMEVSIEVPLDVVAGGKGTLTEPYLMSKPEHLKYIKFELTGSYKLISDIDLKNEEWIPIGTQSVRFTGTFDGGDYTISNLKISKTTSYIGFFGYTDNGTIKNLNIQNANISGNSYVGGLVGLMFNSKVSKCSITGNGTISGSTCVGGLIGFVNGGLASLTESNARVDVTGATYIGGLAGASAGNINKCYAVGDVSGESNVGGLVGNFSSFSSSSANNEISECYAVGDSTSTQSNAGGLIGNIDNDSISKAVINCFALGNVSGASYCGGLIGRGVTSFVKVSNCYSAGKVRVVTGSGGLVGSGTLTSSYFDSTITGITTPATQARTTEQLMQSITFTGWNMTAIWKIDEGLTYPYLRSLPSPSETMKTELTPLVKVEGLTCVAKSATSITLSWKPYVDAESYEIIFNDITLTSKTTTTIIEDLSPNTTYTFQVRAVNVKQKGELSDPLSVKTNFYNPQTAYAKLFYEKCEEQLWFIDELELLLNQYGKSVNTLNSRNDFANIYTISLAGRNISGFIPKAVGEIYNLEYLYLSKNQLTGPIPSELYTLIKLKNLDLSSNELAGAISEQIANLKELQVLLLHNNQLEGNIPVGLCSLTKLENLDLALNNLSGQIPANIGNLINLKFLSLSDNELTGVLPNSLSSLSNLQVLILSNNSINGDVQGIITLFTDLSNLRLIDLSNSSFTADVDDAFLKYSSDSDTDDIILVVK